MKSAESLIPTAVIVAGGKGQRMKSDKPKQFLELDHKPIVCHCIESFKEAFPEILIILVLPEEYINNTELIHKIKVEDENLIITKGGSNRFHSVKNGIRHAPKNSIIFVHDGARPLVSKDLIIRCYLEALNKGSAVPVIKISDSIRRKEGEKYISIDRETIRSVQTPQVFKSEILQQAFEQEYIPEFTDEATVVEYLGQALNFIDGEESNIKITHPIDLIIANALINHHKNRPDLH